jgi:hypothetical protein
MSIKNITDNFYTQNNNYFKALRLLHFFKQDNLYEKNDNNFYVFMSVQPHRQRLYA